MVQYYFPPLGGIGSVRAVKFARYLPDFGWHPVVLAPRRGFYHQDPTLEDGAVEVERSSSIELSRAARQGLAGRGGDDLTPLRPQGMLARVQRFARRWLYLPDAQAGWYPFAVQAGRRLLREGRFDAVFSSSFPITAHLVARRLAADHRLPWVAEFRDPWTDVAPADSRLRRAIDRRLEDGILARASAVVTVSEGFADLLRAHSARHVEVIPNGFDPADYPADEGTDDHIAFLGTYYPGRQDLDTAIEALGALARQGQLGATRLLFVGDQGPQVRASLEAAGLGGRFNVTGFLPHREALRAITRARLLLLVGARDAAPGDPFVRGWIPAKTFEYLGARRPILCVGNPHSEMADLVRQSGAAAVVASGDRDQAAAAILRLLQAARVDWTPRTMSYTRRALAERLAKVLSSV